MIGPHTRLQEDDDLPLCKLSSSHKEKAAILLMCALITREMIRSKDV